MPEIFLRGCILLALFCGMATAAEEAHEATARLRLLAERHLHELIKRTDPALRAQVEIGPIDPRLRLPPCKHPQWFLPAGARLQGHGTLGVRCEDAAEPWTLYLSYKISLQGPALVAKRPLAARQVIMANDVELKEIAYEAAAGEYLRDPALLEGALTARSIQAGQAITLDRLLRSPSVRAGQRVKAWLHGSGFYITQEGVALNNALPGETVRVRTDAGKVIQGLATRDGRVQVVP